jgi:dipeptidyl aminopeptidase/acylaminoacyl peptidase
MTDERRQVDDARLADLLRSYADRGLRPFEPGTVAATAMARNARRQRPTWLLPRGLWQRRQVSLLVALGLLLLAAAAMTVVGAATLLEQRPIPGMIAVWGYPSGGQGADEIRLIHPRGTGETLLPSTGHDSHPVFSPDGTRIAYTSHDGRAPVRVVNADGTGASPVIEGYASPYPVAWSPDAKRIAFVGYRYPGAGDRGLYVVNDDGSGLVLVVRAEQRELMRLAWSPDGSLISVVVVGGTPERLAPGEVAVDVVDPRTGSVVRVSKARLLWEEDHGAPSWSPDSSRLLYAVAATGAGSSLAVAERGPGGWSEQIVVTNPSGGLDTSPLWLDADRFVFVRDRSRLVAANADGSGQRVLLRENLLDRAAPCVAPDGSAVAVPLAQEDGSVRGELLVVAVDAAVPPQRIPTGAIRAEGPGCSWQAVKR